MCLHNLRDQLFERDLVGAAFSAGVAAAQLRLMTEDTVAALKDVDELTHRFSDDSLGAWEPPALLAARLYARAGQRDSAIAVYERYGGVSPSAGDALACSGPRSEEAGQNA